MQAAKNEVVGAFYRIGVKGFQFLVDEFEFEKAIRKADVGIYRLISQNRVTAVEIGLEWREQYIYVELSRLIKGKIRENPVVISKKSRLNTFNLEDLLAVRAPGLRIGPEYFVRPLTVESVNYILTRYADSLHEFARDVLRGDFSVFAKLNAIVKGRLLTDPSEGIAERGDNLSFSARQRQGMTASSAQRRIIIAREDEDLASRNR
jgi:hypothetical protein